jgi:hypothetical protein
MAALNLFRNHEALISISNTDTHKQNQVLNDHI